MASCSLTPSTPKLVTALQFLRRSRATQGYLKAHPSPRANCARTALWSALVEQAFKALTKNSVKHVLVSPLGSLLSDGELDALSNTTISRAPAHGIVDMCRISMPSYEPFFEQFEHMSTMAPKDCLLTMADIQLLGEEYRV